MHTLTVEKNHIKIVYDKQSKLSWSWEIIDAKRLTNNDYKQRGAIITFPKTAKNFSQLFKQYADNGEYFVSDEFIEEYQKTLKEDKLLETKRKLLKEKLSLENISERQDLLEYTKERLPNCPEDKLKPYKHQKLELEYAVRFPAFYSLDEMGLGKSRVAIDRHVFLKEKLKKIDKSIIICPVSLMYNWANEIEEFANKTYLIISGSKKDKIFELNATLGKIDFYIINYEGINSIKENLLNLIDDRTNIIIDEFIKIKNPSAIRTKNLRLLTDKTPYVMGLCGTPISQGSADLFSPNLCIDKGKKFGFSYDRFIDRYFWREGWNIYPKRNAHKKLSEKLYENAIRFTKKECLDIPEKRYQQILIDLPKKNQQVYDQMLNFCLTELEGKEATAPIILVQLLRLSQITSGFIKTPTNQIVEFKEQPKIKALKDLFISNNGTQMIVWSRFVRDIKAIAQLCIEQNMSFGCLIGSSKDFNYSTEQKIQPNSPMANLMKLIQPIENPINADTIKKAYFRKVKKLHPDLHNQNYDKQEELKKINSLYNSVKGFSDLDLPKDMQSKNYDIPSNLIGTDSYTRQDLVSKFQAGKIQVMIGTASTGGMGLNLTKAQRVIYYSNDYSLINRLQSEDRAHRSGQKNRVLYYDILANNTIDASILSILMGKKSVADIITKDNLLNIAKGKK